VPSYNVYPGALSKSKPSSVGLTINFKKKAATKSSNLTKTYKADIPSNIYFAPSEVAIWSLEAAMTNHPNNMSM